METGVTAAREVLVLGQSRFESWVSSAEEETMEITEITPGASFSTARELPCSTVRPAAKTVSAKTSGNGVKKPKGICGDTAWEKSKFFAEEKKADHVISEASKMIMVLVNGKCRFVRLSEYRAT